MNKLLGIALLLASGVAVSSVTKDGFIYDDCVPVIDFSGSAPCEPVVYDTCAIYDKPNNKLHLRDVLTTDGRYSYIRLDMSDGKWAVEDYQE